MDDLGFGHGEFPFGIQEFNTEHPEVLLFLFHVGVESSGRTCRFVVTPWLLIRNNMVQSDGFHDVFGQGSACPKVAQQQCLLQGDPTDG